MFTIEEQVQITAALILMRDMDAENGHTDEVAKTNAALAKMRAIISGEAYVYVATYEHRHGTDTQVFSTAKGAQDWKREVAADSWGEISDEDFPEDGAELYFEEMANREREWFLIEQTKLGA